MTRDFGAIDAELKLIAALRRGARLRGGPLPTNARIDDLLDQRLTYADGTHRSALEPHARATTAAPSTLG